MRKNLKNQFLKQLNLEIYDIQELPSDASFRSYSRIVTKDGSYFLMDAPPELEPTASFVAIGNYLISQGLKAPSIIQSDIENGFLLLEDLGEGLYTPYLKNNPGRESELYHAAIDNIVRLQHLQVPDFIPPYTMEIYLREAVTFIDWYYKMIKGETAPDSMRAEFLEIMTELINALSQDPGVIVHRDFMADNLMWLDGEGVGILDFQDALIGHKAYDLMSLLEDARRDVSQDLANNCIQYYLSNSGNNDVEGFMHDYSILAAQRNLKIIGYFSRKLLRDNNSKYIHYLPRVINYLRNDLKHPALAGLKAFILRNISLDYTPPKFENIMILAAGFGKRMLPLTQNKPKPMVEVAGKALIDHILLKLVDMDLGKIVVNLHYHGEKLAKHLQDFWSTHNPKAQLILKYENEILESGGGIVNALPEFGDQPILVINSDTFWLEDGESEIRKLTNSYRPYMDYLLMLTDKREVIGFEGAKGDFDLNGSGRIIRNEALPYLFVGLYIIHPRVFKEAPKTHFSMQTLFFEEISKENSSIYGCLSYSKWVYFSQPKHVEIAHNYLKTLA